MRDDWENNDDDEGKTIQKWIIIFLMWMKTVPPTYYFLFLTYIFFVMRHSSVWNTNQIYKTQNLDANIHNNKEKYKN